MNKALIAIVVAAVLGVGGWYGFQQYQVIQARRATAARVAVEQARQRAEEARLQKQQVAIAAMRKDVEAQLKTMKVSSLSPGRPGWVIVDRVQYGDGEFLPLPKGGKKLQVATVREDGVLLTGEGQTYRLDPPAVPDLAASRKGR